MTTRQAGLTVSRRGRTLPSSPIRRLGALADDARRRGIRVIHLNIGQPDLPPPAGVVRALADAPATPLVYAPSRGIAAVVDDWLTYYRSHGLELEVDEVLVTAGASEALSLALLATCDVGDEVLVPEPFYAPYLGMVAIAGLRLAPVPFGPGFSPPSADALRARLTAASRALLVCSPNNPTGTVYSRHDLAAIGEVARQAGLFVIADETYREFVFDGPPATSALALPGLEEHVVVVDSVSKRFNACGLRIGSLVTRNPLVMAAALELAELRLAVPVVDQLAIRAALTAPRPYVDDVVATYRERVDVVVGGLSAIPAVVAHRPDGAFYVVARLPVDDAERFAAWLLRDFALDGETVMVTPLSDFYATPGRGRDEIRVACVHDVATLARAIHLLGRGLVAYPSRA